MVYIIIFICMCIYNYCMTVLSGCTPILVLIIHVYSYRFVAGVVEQERLAAFERVLWRACRGNVFMRQTPIEEPLEDPITVSTQQL